MVFDVQGCDSDTLMERNTSLCLVLNKVWLSCSDVPEDSLAQDIRGNSQQTAGTPACLPAYGDYKSKTLCSDRAA